MFTELPKASNCLEEGDAEQVVNKLIKIVALTFRIRFFAMPNRKPFHHQRSHLWNMEVVAYLAGPSVRYLELKSSTTASYPLLRGLKMYSLCDQSYKHFTLINYDSRVVIWGIFQSGTTLES